MTKIEKVVLIKNAVETLGYFSEQIALELNEMGLATYFVDYDDLFDAMEGLKRFAGKGNTAVITFNFIGFSGETVFLHDDSHTVWDVYKMPILNILVDHPIYYHSKLEHVPKRMKLYCIDKEHVRYIKRFYPGLNVKFLPIAGNVLLKHKFEEKEKKYTVSSRKKLEYDAIWNYEKHLIPYEIRKYDLVFTANYVPLESLYRRFDDMVPAYATFYRGILEDLIAQPMQSVDVVMERHIAAELGEVADGDIRAAMSGMIFIDLCARTYYRGEIIRELAEHGLKVHVFGADWGQLPCKKPENIIHNGRQVSSAVCVQAVRDAKIALNIMPWFKDGVHDRIFTAMLQKTVALTDSSKYLRKEFTDGEDIVFFSLEGRKYLPDLVHMLLRDEENAMQIAENGYRQAYGKHTWRARARELAGELQHMR